MESFKERLGKNLSGIVLVSEKSVLHTTLMLKAHAIVPFHDFYLL